MRPVKTTIAAALLAAPFAASAQDSGSPNAFSGSVTMGGIVSNTSSDNAWKAKEYRDIENGFLGGFEFRGRGENSWMNGYGENIGREDQLVDVRGGRYDVLRFQLYDDRMVHNWTFGAKTPYAGIGGDTLTATLPNLNTATWNSFDLKKNRENVGGALEFWNGTPWFFKVDANEVLERGTYLTAGSNGTSPGNGFTDKPMPLDWKTRNFNFETGYASKRGQGSVSFQHSTFSNATDTLQWTNGFFGGNRLDTSYLAPDSQYTKLGANGTLKQLPADSTLAARLTYSRTTSNFGVAPTALDTGGVFAATNPNQANFNGDNVHATSSLSLHSNWSRALDSRIYWNYFRKDNRSTEVTFSPAGTTGLQCGGGPCTTENLSYKKNNLGADAGYRFDPQNRLVLGFDYLNIDRNRVDSDNTKDKRASAEYRNTTFDWMGARLKYQYMERRSNFLEGNSGVDGSDPNYLNRFIARFDVANVNQNLLKLVFDFQPQPLWDIGAELIGKDNRYKDTVLGRTRDTREEVYLSTGYGDPRSFRVLAFTDFEWVKYNSTHRNISQLTAAGGVTATSVYDPTTPAQCNGANCNYNWDATNRDRSFALGVGADWLPIERLKLNGSVTYTWSHGTADFAVQPTPNPINPPAVPIGNFDNMRKMTLNIKGTYAIDKPLDLAAGWAYEKYKFSDIATDGYQYTIGTGTGTSYLSGAYAFTNYTTNIFYLTATYKFQ